MENNVYVSGLGPHADWNLLSEHFGKVGNIIHMEEDKCPDNDIPMRNSRTPFDMRVVITYRDVQSVHSAIAKYHNCVLNGRKIVVKKTRNESEEFSQNIKFKDNYFNGHLLNYYDGRNIFNQDLMPYPSAERQDLFGYRNQRAYHDHRHYVPTVHQDQSFRSQAFVNKRTGFDENRGRVPKTPISQNKNRIESIRESSNYVRRLLLNTEKPRNRNDTKQTSCKTGSKSNNRKNNSEHNKIDNRRGASEQGKTFNMSTPGGASKESGKDDKEIKDTEKTVKHKSKTIKKRKSKKLTAQNKNSNDEISDKRNPIEKHAELPLNNADKLMNALLPFEEYESTKIAENTKKQGKQKLDMNRAHKMKSEANGKNSPRKCNQFKRNLSTEVDAIVGVLNKISVDVQNAERDRRLKELNAEKEREELMGGPGAYKCGLGRGFSQPMQFMNRNFGMSRDALNASSGQENSSAGRGRGHGRGTRSPKIMAQ